MNNETEAAETGKSEDEFQWEQFEEDLVDYVRLELEGQNVEDTYEDWAFHIQTSIECYNAYLHELQRQSLERVDGAVLQRVSTLLQSADNQSSVQPAANWLIRTIEHGRAWLESESQRWRQIEVSLSGLTMGSPDTQAAVGLMSDESAQAVASGGLQLTPDDSNFELDVVISPDENSPALCQADVTVTLIDRFGDYSGSVVYLAWEETVNHGSTDELGRVRFSSLPKTKLNKMNLTVVFPDEDDG